MWKGRDVGGWIGVRGCKCYWWDINNGCRIGYGMMLEFGVIDTKEGVDYTGVPPVDFPVEWLAWDGDTQAALIFVDEFF